MIEENSTRFLDEPSNGVLTPSSRRVGVSIILPAYNEAEALPSVLDSLFAVVHDAAEVIVVDDASTDNSAAIASRYPCRVLAHRVNRGKGAAVRTGIAAATGEFVVVMDADNTYPVDVIPQMVELAESNDFVRCTRTQGAANMPLTNRIGNRLFDWLLKVLHGLEGSDHLSGLYGFRRDALADLRVTADRFDLEVEIGIQVRARRLRVAVVPINYGQRLGDKKLRSYRDGWAILQRVLSMALLYNPVLCFVIPGFLLWTLTLALTAVLIVHPIGIGSIFLSHHGLIVAAMCTTVGFQLIVFGIAAGLYGVERGTAPSPWLLTLGRREVRLVAILVGTGAACVGALMLLTLISQWVASGARGFSATGSVIAAGVLLTGGVEMSLAALFVSIFAGRLLTDEERRASGPKIASRRA